MRAITKGLVGWTNVATAMAKLLLREFPVRHSTMLLMPSTVILLFGLIVTAPLSVALAAPIQGPKGQACKSTGTITGYSPDDNKTCTFDSCTYYECDTSGPYIGKCFEKTHYMNKRDCHAALIKRPQTLIPGTGGLKHVEPPAPVPPGGPRPPVIPGQMQR